MDKNREKINTIPTQCFITARLREIRLILRYNDLFLDSFNGQRAVYIIKVLDILMANYYSRKTRAPVSPSSHCIGLYCYMTYYRLQIQFTLRDRRYCAQYSATVHYTCSGVATIIDIVTFRDVGVARRSAPIVLGENKTLNFITDNPKNATVDEF